MVTRSGSPQSLKRLSICTGCEMNTHGICSECGCIIKAKVRVEYPLDEDGKTIGGCPLEKW